MTISDDNGKDVIAGTRAYQQPQGTRPHIDFGQSPPVSVPGARVAAALEPGKLIADRYRIERSFKEQGGQSQLYLCRDAHLPEDSAEGQVAVKLYLQGRGPKQEILKLIRGIKHPDLVHILDIGTWEGQFFEVMEYCRGGSLADAMPYTTAQLRAFLPQIVSGLDHCHSNGITHRDIKPWNLIFRDPERQDLVLTDFGISSYLREWVEQGIDHHLTKTPENFTVDYVSPELLSGRKVPFAMDYYALGITLIHLLTGRSPFAGMNELSVISAHNQNQIPLDGIPGDLLPLVQGLTQFDNENRWGRTQVRQWLAGVAVTDDKGRPWAHKPVLFGVKPFRWFKAATTPDELGRAIMSGAFPQAEAAKHLASGVITYWIADNFDEGLAKDIENRKLLDEVTKDPEGALKELAWLLDPQLALETKDP